MRAFLSIAAAATLFGATVKDDNTALRRGCYPDSDTVATLPKGTAVVMRYALAGEAVPCYKVAAEVGGKKVEGYLIAPMIEGLETFDKARRDATWLDLSQIMGSIKATAERTSSSLSVNAAGPIAAQASALIEASQPARALEILEPEVRKRRDPGLLTLAGIAAWRSDNNPKALEYWRASLDISPNPDLEAFYKKVEQEKNGDKSGDRLMGMRVQLRYEGISIPADTAREMLNALDQEFTRISTELGCSAEERVLAIAQSPQAYRASTNAAEWSGGQFDGKIRVPVEVGRGVDRKVLAHEVAHACLSLIGRWPSWLQEGVAQKVSGEVLQPAMREQLKRLAAEGKLPKLSQLGQDWSRMDTKNALLAYALALHAIEIFERDYGAFGLRNLFRNSERLTAITADLDRRLGL